MIKKIYKFAFVVFLLALNSANAGVYKGKTDDQTFISLLIEVQKIREQLDQKIAQAKTLGLNTDYAQISQVTITLFKDVFAPWDRANIDKVQAMYNAKYFSQFDPVGAIGLPFDELSDCLDVAESAIAQLQDQIDGKITLTSPPDFKSNKLVLKGANYELSGNKVIAGKFFWQPNQSDIMEAYGYGGEGYYSVQDLKSETSLKIWRNTNFINLMDEQLLNNRSPIQFFLGHIVPQTYWLRQKYPAAFEKGSRLFTDYDIDNPNVRDWMNTLFTQQLSSGVNRLGDTERVHMIANEPTFSIREGGVNADRGVSEHTLTKYTQWLTKKYQSITTLNDAYETNFTKFDELKTVYTIPLSLSYQGGAAWYDWNRFNMDRVNEWFTFLHNGIHDADPSAKTHIKIMGERSIHTQYQDEGLDFEYIAKLVDMPGSDNQSSSLAAHWDVRHDLTWQDRYSLEWRAQTMMLDFNKSIVPEKHFYDSEWHGLSGARWRDFHMSPEYVRSTLWLAATHGLGSLTSWVWNRKEDGSIDPRADFIGTSVTQPIQLDAYGRTLKELNSHGNKISSLIPIKRNYLIYYNKDSAIQDSNYTHHLSEVYEAVKLLNIPTGFTTPAELLNAEPQTQVVIIPPTHFISDNDLSNLAVFVGEGGKVVLFDKTVSFTKTELGKIRSNANVFTPMSTLTISDILTMTKSLQQTLKEATLKQTVTVNILNTQQQEAFGVISQQNLEHSSNRTLVSLINTSNKVREVSLKIDTKRPTDIVNVITQQAVNSSFTMKPLDVLLLSIGNEALDIIQPIQLTAIAIVPNSLTLVEGQSKNLTVLYTPTNADDKTITWHSTNSSVVSVNNEGKVIGLIKGDSTIVATSIDGQHVAEVSINVTALNIGNKDNLSNEDANSAGGSLFFSFFVLFILFIVRNKYVL